MPRIEFPFKAFVPGGQPRPYLQVKVVNPHSGNELIVYGLIDTGADECAFPSGYATLLGHDLQKGPVKHINTGNGQTLAYGHMIRIEVAGVVTENVMLDFMPNLNVPLLGVRSFLSRFVLTIDYPRLMFSLAC
jgi:predicted aspartyl protease